MGSFSKDKLAEVFIHCNEYSPLRFRSRKEHTIPGIRPLLAGVEHIVPLLSQPFRQTTAGAPIDQELHLPPIRTAFSESWAMTACA